MEIHPQWLYFCADVISCFGSELLCHRYKQLVIWMLILMLIVVGSGGVCTGWLLCVQETTIRRTIHRMYVLFLHSTSWLNNASWFFFFLKKGKTGLLWRHFVSVGVYTPSSHAYINWSHPFCSQFILSCPLLNVQRWCNEGKEEQRKCRKELKRSDWKNFGKTPENVKCFKCRSQQIMYRIIRVLPLYTCLLFVTCSLITVMGASFNHTHNLNTISLCIYKNSETPVCSWRSNKDHRSFPVYTHHINTY